MSTTESESLELGDSFAREFPELGVEWTPAAVPAPTLVAFNNMLAVELGLDPDALTGPAGVAMLAGNAVPPGSAPIAMGYAGHQFGSFSGRLGDGRALLLGELTDPAGRRRDLHLKGSGRTPYARGGDGKAALGPMLREYLMAEALHALGIRTARALSVVATGEQVQREDPLPGAVLARVADSHIRIGTFELAVRLGDTDTLQRLADHSIERHHPAAAGPAGADSAPAAAADHRGTGRYLGLLEAVVEVQAELIADWMLVGFVHGVLNTDNVTISGETIDYGPCAFMDRYDPATVFSSIDHGGRYAYGNQPVITQWNLARLAEALLPLIDRDAAPHAGAEPATDGRTAADGTDAASAADDSTGPDSGAVGDTAIAEATAVLATFPDRYQRHWLAGMRRKLGLGADPSAGHEFDEADGMLAQDLLGLLAEHRVDYTSAFRALAATLRGDRGPIEALVDPPSALDEWLGRWQSGLDASGLDRSAVATEMDRVNPLYIPRNHLVEEALAAATAGDLDPFHTLLDAVTQPYELRADREPFATPAPESFTDGYQTFCGT